MCCMRQRKIKNYDCEVYDQGHNTVDVDVVLFDFLENESTTCAYGLVVDLSSS